MSASAPVYVVNGFAFQDIDPDTLRLPPIAPNKDIETPQTHTLQALPGVESLFPRHIAEPSAPLKLPDGLAKDVEKSLAQGNFEKALAELEAHREGDGEFTPDLAVSWVQAYIGLGNLQKARTLLSPLRNDSAFALAHAVIALAENNLEETSFALDDAYSTQRSLITYNYYRALWHVARDEARDARLYLTKVAQHAPYHAMARWRLGQLAIAEGDTARGGVLLEMAHAIAPHAVDVGVTLARLLAESGLASDAMHILDALNRRDVTALKPWILKIQILMALDQMENAENILLRLKGDEPDDHDLNLLHARILVQKGDTEQASLLLAELTQAPDPNMASSSHVLIAQLSIRTQPPALTDAAQHLQKALNLTPKEQALWLDLAQVYFAMADHDSSKDALSQLDEKVDINVLLTAAAFAQRSKWTQEASRLANTCIKKARGGPLEADIFKALATIQIDIDPA